MLIQSSSLDDLDDKQHLTKRSDDSTEEKKQSTSALLGLAPSDDQPFEECRG